MFFFFFFFLFFFNRYKTVQKYHIFRISSFNSFYLFLVNQDEIGSRSDNAYDPNVLSAKHWMHFFILPASGKARAISG